MSLYCQDGQGSNSEVGETHCSGKSKDCRRQREKSQWGLTWLCLGHLSMGIFLPTNTARWTQLSFLPLLTKASSCALGLSHCFPPGEEHLEKSPSCSPCPEFGFSSQVLLPVTLTAPLKAFASPPTSFSKSHRVSRQKEWQALAQLPNTPIGLSLPSSFPYSKCSQQNLLSASLPVQLGNKYFYSESLNLCPSSQLWPCLFLK